MSAEQRPWWASDGPVDGGVDRTRDPVDAFRASRRGEDDPGATTAGPWWEAAVETVARLADDLAETADAHEATTDEATTDEGIADPTAPGAGPTGQRGPPEGGEDARSSDSAESGPVGPDEEAHRVDVCGVCPVCMGLRALGESRPELVGHLAEAARQVALAARSLAARPSESRDGSADDSLQRIDLDD